MAAVIDLAKVKDVLARLDKSAVKLWPVVRMALKLTGNGGYADAIEEAHKILVALDAEQKQGVKP